MSELDGKSSWRLWLIAALVAVLLHVGGIAAAVFEMQQEEDDDGLGASGIEVGMEMVSVDVDPTEDVPLGPDSAQQVASQAVQEQKAVEKETDLPKEMPRENEDADRAVSETESKKPEEVEPEKAVKKQEAQDAADASDAAAYQRIEDTKAGDKPVVQNPGLLRDKKRLTQKWNKQLTAYLQSNKRYPDVEKSRDAVVKITFTLDRLGKVISSSVTEGSGDAAFDEAAISILHRAKYLPKPPPEVADDGLSFTVDINFTKGKK
ncbi:TonB family protein [Tardiphaga sp. 804_B3_N1_9]|jgi:protein TonB|uniref:TonB family protein n=1 Tax=Tardiphaga TaxID=1395974 RepID=UPI0015862544|nr:TonB family protein [Tardiphaga robiniae]NUU42123.1 energy transducer TonB [Tardiphaga robiniae]